MDKLEILDLIYQALRRANDPRIDDVTYDGDHKSGEIDLTVGEGENKQTFVISSETINETDPTEEE